MKKKIDKDSRGIFIGTAVIVAAMIVVFGAVFVWMYSVDLLFLPDFVENIFGIGGDGDAVYTQDELSGIVAPKREDDGDTAVFDITYENLRAALVSKKPPEGYYLSADIGYYGDSGVSAHRIRVWRDGDRFRTESYADSTTEHPRLLCIGDAESILVNDMQGGDVRILPRGDFLPENEIGIPSVDELLGTVASFPEILAPDAGETVSGTDTAAHTDETDVTEAPAAVNEENTEFTDCELSLIRTDSGNVYLIAFTHAGLGIREEYYVALENRSVISHVTYANGNPVYSYTQIRYSENPDDYSEDSLYAMTLRSEPDQE